MPKYDIQVLIHLEAEDMEFDSEAEAEAYGWKMVDMVHQYYINVENIEVIRHEEEEE